MGTEKDILDRLRHAIATASNDDYSEPHTFRRGRHSDRIDTMHAAISEIERLRRENEIMKAADYEALKPDERTTS